MIRGKMKMFLFLVFTFFAVMAFSQNVLAGDDVPRMTKEKLKSLLGNENVIILDVRIGRDWETSGYKIKGAIREEPRDFSNWKDKYPKDKTLVLYCA
jgi:hypothetical protein